MLICLMPLLSCEHTKQIVETKREPILITDDQFSCEPPPATKLPNNDELKNWTDKDLFKWGSENYFWGSICQKKLTDVKDYIKCFNDPTSCSKK